MDFRLDWPTVSKRAEGIVGNDETISRKCAAKIRDFWASHGAYPNVEVVFLPNRVRRDEGVWVIKSDIVNGLPVEFR